MAIDVSDVRSWSSMLSSVARALRRLQYSSVDTQHKLQIRELIKRRITGSIIFCETIGESPYDLPVVSLE